jgi:hypothetical protein
MFKYVNSRQTKPDQPDFDRMKTIEFYNWHVKNNPMWCDENGEELEPITEIEDPPEDLDRHAAEFDQLLRYGLVEYVQDKGWLTETEFVEYMKANSKAKTETKTETKTKTELNLESNHEYRL